MIKLVGLDVDGTLVDSTKKIPKCNLDAISEAYSKGVKFAIISGRISQSAAEYQARLGVEGPVSSFGGCVFEDEKGNILEEYLISNEVAHYVYSLSKECNITLLMYNHYHWYADGKGSQKWYESEQAATNVDGVFVDDIDLLIDTVLPNKFLAICDRPEDGILFSQKLTGRYPDCVKTIFSAPQFIEVLPKNASKGSAIKALMKYWGFSKEEIMVVGDYDNDIDMFLESGTAVAVANATYAVKKVATFISPFTNEESAVADAIKRFVI